MRKLIERCPACGGELVVTRMDCHQCRTGVEGQFQPSDFDRLSPENLAFVELFVRLKGNMKEMERDLEVPYSTVRHRLDEVVRELGPRREALTVAPVPPVQGPALSNSAQRREILDRLERGEITPDEAIQQLGGAR